MKPRPWQIKHWAIAPFMRSKTGENLYEWLTAVILETQRGLSRKWAYWFREHAVLCRRYGRIRLREKRIWLFEPGWSLTPVILSRLVTGRGPLITENRVRLSRRYVAAALREAAGAAPPLLDRDSLGRRGMELLELLRGMTSPLEILGACEAEYRMESENAWENPPKETVDLCFSMGRLEHYSREELSRLLAGMHRRLKPGGLGSHIVDHRDHFWHFDKSISCFHHLTYSDEEWRRLARGRHIFRNRLLERDYLRMFEESGFEVLAAIHRLHRRDADGVDPASLWGRFSEITREDLEAAVTHFVLRRRR